MKSHTLLVTITFSEKYTSDEDKSEIIENVQKCLVNSVLQGNDFAPISSDGYVTAISTMDQLMEIETKNKFKYEMGSAVIDE